MNYITISILRSSLVLLIVSLLLACNSKPKVVESTSSNGNSTTRSEASGIINNTNTETHEVIVKEVLQAEKYTYLSVTEDGGAPYWIAVTKREVEPGASFQYTGGLLKKNFYSREFDRNFETIYLVSGIRPADGTSNKSALDQAMAKMNEPGDVKPVNVSPPQDGVALDELFSDPQKYAGKTIKVKGQVVKVNNQIMGRNWVHLQDGSADENGERLDLTATTDAQVMVGKVITIEGTIAVNRDFGAGYFYNVIMEEASVVE